jgi:hypothetical protein
MAFFPFSEQQKNLTFLSLLVSKINKVSKRTKFHILHKQRGSLKVQTDKMALFTKYKYPYLTVEVFFSILIAILLQTKRVNKKLANEETIV